MSNFANLGLPQDILNNLNQINFINPTPIQEQAIPLALQGHDILGSAQTGTGKTAAFALPILAHLMKDKSSKALILLPTRELAAQVIDAIKKMQGNNKKGIKTALLIGGERYDKQMYQLKANPKIIVGTPGRINDHLLRRTLVLDDANFLVLDETDRMLDMGFGIQLDEIAKFLPEQRQTLMFSATMPKNIMSLSKRFLNNPKRITIGELNQATESVKQEIIKLADAKKYDELKNQLEIREGSVLVFVKTKFGADRLATKLNKENLSADAIHGDLRQNKRDKVIANYRAKKNRVLVATDVAARGLDIPHIENVINYDLPQCPEDYIHRIGRTGRAGATGLAINFLTPSDGAKWKAIYKLLNPSNREKQTLDDGYSPISAEPLMGYGMDNKSKSKSKASTKNPFKPYAPDRNAKKERNRARFNKNARDFNIEEFVSAYDTFESGNFDYSTKKTAKNGRSNTKKAKPNLGYGEVNIGDFEYKNGNSGAKRSRRNASNANDYSPAEPFAKTYSKKPSGGKSFGSKSKSFGGKSFSKGSNKSFSAKPKSTSSRRGK